MYKACNGCKILTKDSKLKNYFLWSKENSIRIRKVDYPAFFHPGYLGFIAKEKIGKNEEIVAVPEKVLITSRLAEKSEISEIFKEKNSFFKQSDYEYEDMVLATFLLNEKRKGKDSKWKNFLENQPGNIELLQDWDNSELDELQDEHVYYDVGMLMKKELDLYYNWKRAVIKADFHKDLIGIELFSWARRVVTTRSFGKFCPYTTLAPIAEFFNHNNTQTYYTYGSTLNDGDYLKRYQNFNLCEDDDDEIFYEEDISKFSFPIFSSKCGGNFIEFNQSIENNSQIIGEVKESKNKKPKINNSDIEGNELIIRTGDEDYEKGSEVYLSYGRYSNYMLLRTYGFAIKNNSYDYAKLIVMENDISIGNNYRKSVKTSKSILFKIKLDNICLELLNYILFCNIGFSQVEILKIYSGLIKKKIKSFATTINEDLVLLDSDLSIKLNYAVRPK